MPLPSRLRFANEDTGSLFISVDAAPGTTLAETNDILTEMQNSIKDIEEIQTYNQVAGFSFSGSGASHAMMMIRLKDWSLRPDKDQSYTAVIEKIYANTAHIKNAQIFIFAPPMISGYGTGNSFFVDLQDRSGRGIDALEEVTQGFIAALNERPEVQMAYTSFSSDFPQYQIDVDVYPCRYYHRCGALRAVGLLRQYVRVQLQPFHQALSCHPAGSARVQGQYAVAR